MTESSTTSQTGRRRAGTPISARFVAAPRAPWKRDIRGELGWVVATVVLAAGFALAVMFLPAALVLAAGGVIVLVMCIFYPKAFALLAIVTVILVTPLTSIAGSAAGNADEAVIVLSVVSFATRRLITERRLVGMPGLYWFLAFLAIGAISAEQANVRFSTYGLEALLIAKAYLFAFALAQLRWNERDLRILVRAGIACILFVAFTGLINLVAPGPWSSLLYNGAPTQFISGIPAVAGPFQHPAAFGRFVALLTVSIVAYGFVVRRSFGNTALALITGGLALTSFAVKTIVSLLGTVMATIFRFAKPVTWVAILCIVPLVGAIVLPALTLYVGADVQVYILQDSARSKLTLGGFELATQHFPWGAGFGRWGSSPAATDYSPEYIRRGFQYLYGLGPGEAGMFLNDTQWPSIIGEAGWIGAGCFAVAVVLVGVMLMRKTGPLETPLVRWIRISGLLWLVVLLIESIGAPVFVSAPSYPFAFAAVGIVASIRHSMRTRPEDWMQSTSTASGGVKRFDSAFR